MQCLGAEHFRVLERDITHGTRITVHHTTVFDEKEEDPEDRVGDADGEHDSSLNLGWV